MRRRDEEAGKQEESACVWCLFVRLPACLRVR